VSAPEASAISAQFYENPRRFSLRPAYCHHHVSMNVHKMMVWQEPIGMEWNMHMLLSGLGTPVVQFGAMGVAVAMVVTFLMRP
jgi:hypothetical protein